MTPAIVLLYWKHHSTLFKIIKNPLELLSALKIHKTQLVLGVGENSANIYLPLLIDNSHLAAAFMYLFALRRFNGDYGGCLSTCPSNVFGQFIGDSLVTVRGALRAEIPLAFYTWKLNLIVTKFQILNIALLSSLKLHTILYVISTFSFGYIAPTAGAFNLY